MHKLILPSLTLAAFVLYWVLILMLNPANANQKESVPTIVLVAAAQVLMYAGDRFLAANIETIRASAEMTSIDSEEFRLRSHKVASLLNPCHEDNYWFANSSLSWGGAVSQGMDVLQYASQCRFWDEWPPFFFAFNENFFYQDSVEAQRVLKIAAERSNDNKAAFLTYATMLSLDHVKNAQVALRLLETELKQARSKDHERILSDRIERLKGLLSLREAQVRYEEKFGRKLEQPDDLIKSGIIDSPPKDPLRLGYEFREQMFQLKQLRVR